MPKFINLAMLAKPDGDPYLQLTDPECLDCAHRQEHHADGAGACKRQVEAGGARQGRLPCPCAFFIAPEGKAVSLAKLLTFILNNVPVFKLKTADQASLYHVLMACGRAKAGGIVEVEEAPFEFLERLFSDDALGVQLSENISGAWAPSAFGTLAFSVRQAFRAQFSTANVNPSVEAVTAAANGAH